MLCPTGVIWYTSRVSCLRPWKGGTVENGSLKRRTLSKQGMETSKYKWEILSRIHSEDPPTMIFSEDGDCANLRERYRIVRTTYVMLHTLFPYSSVHPMDPHVCHSSYNYRSWWPQNISFSLDVSGLTPIYGNYKTRWLTDYYKDNKWWNVRCPRIRRNSIRRSWINNPGKLSGTKK